MFTRGSFFKFGTLGSGKFLSLLDLKIFLLNTNIVFRKYNVGAILENKTKEEYFISLKITQKRKLHTLKPNHVLCAAAWLQTKSQRHTTMMFNLKNVYRHFWLNTWPTFCRFIGDTIIYRCFGIAERRRRYLLSEQIR